MKRTLYQISLAALLIGKFAFPETLRTTVSISNLNIGNQSSVTADVAKTSRNKAILSSGTISSCQTETSSCSGSTKRSFSGLFATTLSSCSASGDYSTLAGKSSLGITFDGFALSRDFKSSDLFSLAHSSPACPSANTSYNYLILRGRNYNDFTDRRDYNSTSSYTSGGFTYLPGWVGGKMSYQTSTSSFTGNSRFSLADLTTANQNVTFSYSGFSGDTCSSVVSPNPPVSCRSKSAGRLLSVGSGADEPIGSYVSWTFGPTIAAFSTTSGNPVMGVAVPVNSLASTAFSSRKNNAYTGLYTYYRGRSDQVQDIVFITPDTTNGTTLTIQTAGACNPQQVTDGSCTCTSSEPVSTCTSGRYLDNLSQRSSLATLTCNTLNSPLNGFCSGTYTPTGSSTSGTAVCLPSFNTNGQDLLFCVAQVPSTDSSIHKKTIATFVATTTERTRLDVTLAACDSVTPTDSATKGELHLNNTTNSGIFTVKATNVSSREISTLSVTPGFPQNATVFPVTAMANSCEGLSPCGSSLPAFSSCKQTVVFSPGGVGTNADTFAFNYHNGQGTVTSSYVEMRGTKGLNSLGASFPTSTDYFSSNKSASLSSLASWATGISTALTSANGVSWSSNNSSVATVDASGAVSFLAREGKATITTSLWSGIKSGTVDAIPYNPGETLILSAHEGTDGSNKIMSDFNSLREGFGTSAQPSAWPTSPVMTILAP